MTDLDRQMASDAPDISDQLEQIRQKLARRRDIDLEVKDAEQRLEELQGERRKLELEVLPTMFAEARIDNLGLPPDGNHPGVSAKLQDFVRANIPAGWPEEKRKAAFETLNSLGLHGLPRRTVSVSLPPGDPLHQEIVKKLSDMGLTVEVTVGVPWATLTAAIRDLIEQDRKPSQEDLDKVGAFVGKIVKLKEVKS